MPLNEEFSVFAFDPAELPRAADPDHAERTLERWLENVPEESSSLANGLAENRNLRALLAAISGNSPFLAQCLQRDAGFVCDLLRRGPSAVFPNVISAAIDGLGGNGDTEALMSGLRLAKRRAALTIACADIAEVWSVKKVMESLSDFADLSISLAIRHVLRGLAETGRIDLADAHEPERESGYVVLGLGKLGARELNYSSDVDLIVLYDPEIVRTDDSDGLSQHMVRATRDMVRILEERTADGYVHRTDLRLRPDPGTTPVAISTLAAETYYESVGQNWERMAMIRARPVAGDLALGERFLRHLRPFIWRKNLDFAAIEDIHSVKRQITAHRGGGEIAVNGHNIKLGRGGIREIEFFAQTQQLIWGGRNQALRGQQVCDVLEALAGQGRITAVTNEEMTEAYRFLRRLEHRLQMVDDNQTHELPKTDARVEKIAIFAGYDSLAEFREALLARLRSVECHYAELFEESADLGAEGSLVFTGNELHPDTLATLLDMGFSDAAKVFNVVRIWHHGRYRATRSERSRQLLTELMPRLLASFSETANPDHAFAKFDDFLGHLPAGVQFLSLLHANPGLLDLVARIMGDAPLLADWLSRNPRLLDHVLTEDFERPIDDLEALDRELIEALDQADHFEHVLDITRRWTNDHKFRVGVQILRGRIDGAAAGPVLSAIAESVLRANLPRVEAEFARLHGAVPGGGMAIIAYGKLGGRELMPESDLDLVFVYDHPDDVDASDGPKPLAPSVYFMRLAQRLTSAVTAPTGEGRLYDLDLRLRPSGNKGPVAVKCEGFMNYQRDSAWIWEHMALTRSRVIAGPAVLCAALEAGIREILTAPRDTGELLAAVTEMRARITTEHKGLSPWDIKHRRGGLVDVEFIAQYLQLKSAAASPDVLSPTTSVTIAKLESAGVLTSEIAADLTQALGLWQRVQSVIRLIGPERLEDDDPPPGQREALVQAGEAADFDTLKARMEEVAARVHEHFKLLIETPGREGN